MYTGPDLPGWLGTRHWKRLRLQAETKRRLDTHAPVSAEHLTISSLHMLLVLVLMLVMR